MELPPDDSCPAPPSSDGGGDSAPQLPPDDDGVFEAEDDGQGGLQLPPDDDGFDGQPVRGRHKCRAVKKGKLKWPRVGPSRRELLGHITHIALRDPGLTCVPVQCEEAWTPQEDGMEVFSPPRVLPVMKTMHMTGSISADLLTGWSLEKLEVQMQLVAEVKARRPKVLILSPPCTMLCVMMNWNWWRMSRSKRERKFRTAILLLEFCMFLVDLQESEGRYYVFEHPLSALTWEQPVVRQLLHRATCMVADFHMCAFGKKSLSGDGYFRKPTRMLTNAPSIFNKLHGRFCPGGHKHVCIQGRELGMQRSAHAQIYPDCLCHALAAGARECVGQGQG